jgi:hypothetical protein
MVEENEGTVPSWKAREAESVVYLESDDFVEYHGVSQAASWTKSSWAALP